jgi:hypothetical protein
MSKVRENVRDSMKDLHAIGLMSDLTMREFDALCLPPDKVAVVLREGGVKISADYAIGRRRGK